MTDNTLIDKAKSKVYVDLSLATDNESALTQMEIRVSNGDDNLTTAQQQRILTMVDQLLIRQND